MSYVNKDGLLVKTNGAEGDIVPGGATAVSKKQFLDLEIEAKNIGSSAVIKADDAYLPVGAYITGAWLLVDEALTSGGSATLTIGLYKDDGSAIDADGIDAAIALSAMDAAGDVVKCDGAAVGGVVQTSTANKTYVGFTYGTAAFTGGKFRLIVEWVR